MDRRACSCGKASFDIRVDDSTLPGTYEFRLAGTDQRIERCPGCDADLVVALEFGEILSS